VAADQVVAGRRVATPPAGTVVFLIGMRINRLWKVRRWGRVAMAMPRMLAELGRQPDLGLLGVRTYVSGRSVVTLQYWRDSDSLERYARGGEFAHLPAWREFNRRIRDNGDVGIFHETYVIGRQESMYVNMPAGYGLAGATSWDTPSRLGQSAAHRLDPTAADEPLLEPY
jgi:hypothetical protein